MLLLLLRLFKFDVELDWPLAERNRRSRWLWVTLLLLFVWLGLLAELREFCCCCGVSWLFTEDAACAELLLLKHALFVAPICTALLRHNFEGKVG